MAGGILGVGQAIEQLHGGVRAWREGDRIEASVSFLGAVGSGFALCGPAGVITSAAISLGTMCYRNRDKIRDAFA